jgi:hypothetical protein
LGAAIEVGFTDPQKTNRLQALTPKGDPITLAVVGRAPILSSEELPTAKRPAQYILDNAIGLDRVQFSETRGNSLSLTLTWQSLRAMPYDATMFVHLKGADGRVLAQTDRQPLNGRFPTSLWLPGQVITDTVSLSLPSDLPNGPLVLNLGMYTWPSLQRLSLRDATRIPQRDDMIVIDVPPSSLK